MSSDLVDGVLKLLFTLSLTPPSLLSAADGACGAVGDFFGVFRRRPWRRQRLFGVFGACLTQTSWCLFGSVSPPITSDCLRNILLTLKTD